MDSTKRGMRDGNARAGVPASAEGGVDVGARGRERRSERHPQRGDGNRRKFGGTGHGGPRIGRLQLLVHQRLVDVVGAERLAEFIGRLIDVELVHRVRADIDGDRDRFPLPGRLMGDPQKVGRKSGLRCGEVGIPGEIGRRLDGVAIQPDQITRFDDGVRLDAYLAELHLTGAKAKFVHKSFGIGKGGGRESRGMKADRRVIGPGHQTSLPVQPVERQPPGTQERGGGASQFGPVN